MRATKYNKSEIMKQAWMMFRSSFYGFASFGEALSAAWRYAKEEVARKEAIEARIAAQVLKSIQPKAETKKDRFYRNFRTRNNAAYRNVRFGRNDWVVDYRRY